MEEERKKIIINEINYWKSHQLLPTHYCNFLLALYTEGEGIIDEKQEKKQTSYYLFYYFFDTIILLLPVLLFQFSNQIILQIIGIIAILFLAVGMMRVFIHHTKLQNSYAVMIFFAVFLFSTTLLLNDYIQIWWIIYPWMLVNSLSWIVFGKLKRQFFLQVAGIFMLIIIAILYGFQIF
ncbi:hypothetical protein JCM21714_113 [Gracilibacillus boraciitolerans JCM 21714]|uniref:Uncharacterized protein n=1 Tax=Gracilibacillus boraciitolerans JCM 21714 TaxID=1298598 RepID=W4VD92_9BACI|nr:hypothetical protein [Gracilibacillus boraciitolerans]GAE91172.1 hypothetical protein JCM21714_113 [Gracilibacillus boraciitolerans JCM 21714]